MNFKRRVLLPGFSLLAITFLLAGTAVAFDKGEGRDPLPMPVPKKSIELNPKLSRSFAFDNDVLVPGSRDQDYTYGLSLSFVGSEVEDQWASLHQPLNWIDHRVGLDQPISHVIESSKIEYGLFGFTPEDISLEIPTEGDRPYASLVYVSSTKERYEPAREVSWQSTLTVGVLGLNLVGEIQESVHSVVGSESPEGWDSQISEGGELTARYSLARQKLLYKGASGLEIKSTLQGSVGYITETSWSLSLRVGEIHSPWVSFNPELTTYGEKAVPTDEGRVSENYFWTGFSVKARAYNAFLQGQFKDSDNSYDSDELNHGIVEAWVGYTVALKNGYGFTYSIRGHTSELRQGIGDRNVVWGGILITKTLS